MRILSVTQTYAPFHEFGGPPVKVQALGQGLALRGHEVTVLTADWGLEARMGGEGGAFKAERCPFGWRHEEKGVKAIYLPTWIRYRSLSWNPAVKRYCRARLQTFDAAHIFGLYDFLGPAVASECRKRRIPYVVEPIGMFVPIVRNLWLKQIYHGVLGRQLFEGAGAIIATSEQEMKELAAGGVAREKILLRRNGVELPAAWPERGAFRKAQGIEPNAKLVLFLGRLSEKKSPDLLLRAFAGLPECLGGKALWLAFAGPDEGGMRTELEKKAAQLDVSSRVRFAGPVFGEAKWSAYRDSDVFVLPSQSENFGNTAAESAVAGTPVIVTEQCGIAQLLAEVAGLVVPHQEAALRQAIERVLSEPGLHERLAAGSASVASQLSWEEPLRDMETLYRNLANKEERGAESEPVR